MPTCSERRPRTFHLPFHATGTHVSLVVSRVPQALHRWPALYEGVEKVRESFIFGLGAQRPLVGGAVCGAAQTLLTELAQFVKAPRSS